jgi:citrate lyase subunit beta / citryl-CoA lyase
MSALSVPSERVAKARSFLFVPGNRSERFEKAARSGADVVILDLEDGVAPSDKPAAREAIAREWPRVRALGVPVVVRLNALSTAYGEDDLEWAMRLASPAAVMLPKAEAAAPIERVHDALGGVAVLPLIESAAGFAALTSVAGARGVLRLFLGHIDFMADTGIVCGEEEAEVAPVRFAMAIATRAHRLSSPVDGVTIQINDFDRLRADTQRSMRFGFGAKMCIHPSQVPVVHEAFRPTEDELAWAHKVLAADAAAGGAATQVDGKLVDLPVVLQARRTVARADR